eukprot:4716050-Amphidinium_carterae.1
MLLQPRSTWHAITHQLEFKKFSEQWQLLGLGTNNESLCHGEKVWCNNMREVNHQNWIIRDAISTMLT